MADWKIYSIKHGTFADISRWILNSLSYQSILECKMFYFETGTKSSPHTMKGACTSHCPQATFKFLYLYDWGVHQVSKCKTLHLYALFFVLSATARKYWVASPKKFCISYTGFIGIDTATVDGFSLTGPREKTVKGSIAPNLLWHLTNEWLRQLDFCKENNRF